MQTRRATAKDIAALSAMAQAAFRDAYGPHSEPDDLEGHLENYFSEAAIAAELAAPGVVYFLAEADDLCAGLVKLRESSVPNGVEADAALELQQLYVATAMQRRGVGQLLIDCAVAWARGQNADGLWLGVWENADWATAFYRRCGFRECGTTTFMLGRTEHRDLVMWRPVSV